MTTRNMHLHYY